MIRINGDWELVESDTGQRKYGNIISKYKCKKCNDTKLMPKYYTNKNVICETCTKIFLDSIINKQFGNWIIIEYSHRDRYSRRFYKCRCVLCDTIHTVELSNILNETTKSCGCLTKYYQSYSNFKHGLYKHPLYFIYHSMLQRCQNKNNDNFIRYGQRGIYVCDEWLGEDGLINFYNWSINNKYIHGLSIHRIDNDGPYAPWNCKWVTREVQQNNTRGNHYVQLNNTMYTIADISRMSNIPYSKISYAILNGKSVHEVLQKLNKKISIISFAKKEEQ